MDDDRTWLDDRRSGLPHAGDAAIDALLRARKEIDASLHSQQSDFTVLFTDIVASAAFYQRYGDTAGLLLLERHNELVLPTLDQAQGAVVKAIGDAVLAVFSSPATAVRAAITIQQRLDAYNEDRPLNERLYTRMGLSHGPLKAKKPRADTLTVAACLVKACGPAQILISRSLAAAVEKEEGIAARPRGTTPIPGQKAPEEIIEVLWTTPERHQHLQQQLSAARSGGTLIGRYQILEELGRGAMGVVYKAYDPTVGRVVALKTVRIASGPKQQELVRRLRQEAQSAGRLAHPNIVTVYDAGEAEGLFYLTMQFIKGKTLDAWLRERKLLPVKQVVLLLEQVCEGLAYAHEHGIVHRDLKPSNVLVGADGRVTIVDFGIAKTAEGESTTAGAVLGTPSYMSPEQAQGRRIDARSDIFSLGTIMYELLTGEKAFAANTPTAVIYKILKEDPIPPREVEPGVSPALEKIVRKALAKDPLQRYQSCRTLLADLKALDKQPVAPARRAPRLEPVRGMPPAAQQRPSRARLAFLLFALLASASALAWQEGLLSPWLDPLVEALATALTSGHTPADSSAEGASEHATPTQPVQAGTTGPAQPPAAGDTASGNQTADTDATLKPKEDKPEPKAAASTPVATKPRRRRRPPPTPALTPEQQQLFQHWLRLARDYEASGRYDQALLALDKALALDPKHAEAKRLREEVVKKQELHAGDNP